MLNKSLLLVSAIFLFFSCSGKVNKDQSSSTPKAEVASAVQNESSNDKVVNFDFNSSALSDESKKILDEKVVSWLKNESKVKVIVQGHCDERGTNAYNEALGLRRAKAVREFLKKNGIKGSRISVISYGETKPVDSASNEEAWAKNRRGVVVGKK